MTISLTTLNNVRKIQNNKAGRTNTIRPVFLRQKPGTVGQLKKSLQPCIILPSKLIIFKDGDTIMIGTQKRWQEDLFVAGPLGEEGGTE